MLFRSILSLSFVENEVSFFSYKNNFLNDNLSFLTRICTYDPREYTAINIHEDLPGIDHIGIISTISKVFTEHNIPILYLNTYSYNLILVADDWREKALTILETFNHNQT